MATDQVLDITTLVKRLKIKIDNKLYDILSVEELSVVDNQRFALWGQDIQKLAADKSKGDELDDLIAELARKVLVGVPDHVFAKLSGTHRFEVVEAFTMLLLRRKAMVAGAIAKTMGLPIGEASSPDFKGSSGDTPDGGSTKRQ
ncbi:hypothetical protein ACIPPQ_14755 [Sphingopyxis sp. LARHCG72]